MVFLLDFVPPSPDRSGNPWPFFFKKDKIGAHSRKQLLKKLLLYSIAKFYSYNKDIKKRLLYIVAAYHNLIYNLFILQ
ncbi:hypothetical protein OA93_17560 [Flavobacterium sp. KMS]|nr:hypothetical protein OA93_17560 [Flavobacterium sp. KMS]